MPKKYEVGQVVGGVTIIGTVQNDKYNIYMLKCNTCGYEFSDYATSVRKHKNGCFQCKINKNREVLCSKEIGKIYGNLKVLEYDEESTSKDKHKSTYVKCQCLKCNSITSIPIARIRAGQAKSCFSCAKKNLELGWDFVKEDCIQGTRVSSIQIKKKNKNNTSGYTGVSKCKNGKYRAYIYFQRKQYHLGEYNTPEDAYEMRLKAEKEIYGDFLQWYASTFPEKWEKYNTKKSAL